jgi:glutamyl-Q tRNA(Asp) synthetase
MTINNLLTYQGRFAPSPTGPLHFGSLIAATGSYLQARHQQGYWRLRIEDIDPPREVTGASEAIIRILEAYGFEWDGEIIYQSERLDIYQEHLQQLINNKLVFPCTCSRKEIIALQKKNHSGVYPGTCRNKTRLSKTRHTHRVIARQGQIHFNDFIQGPQSFSLENEIGDFVIKRADGLFSYQLAVAIDDAITGVTEVVRGSDLLDSTPRQIYLQQLLGLKTPRYLHLPVATNAQGQKLSKQTFAEPLTEHNRVEVLCEVLKILGQQPEAELISASLRELWQWAINNWDINRVPKTRSFTYRS